MIYCTRYPIFIYYASYKALKTTTILTIVAIVAALGAVTSLIPIHQVSAQGGERGGHISEEGHKHACLHLSIGPSGNPIGCV